MGFLLALLSNEGVDANEGADEVDGGSTTPVFFGWLEVAQDDSADVSDTTDTSVEISLFVDFIQINLLQVAGVVAFKAA
jgi:hypothetical protein